MTPYHGLRGKTVLIVEDHPDYREMLALTLRTAGSRVVTASNVSEARREVVAYRPDAVVSDLRLMDGTGLDFIDWLRTTDRERVSRIQIGRASCRERMVIVGIVESIISDLI